MAFVKGQSGNPGGRPKENKEVQELARQYTEEALNRLVFWMRSDNPKASTGATALILDRAWGKAAQAHELTGHDGGPIKNILEVSWKSDDSESS